MDLCNRNDIQALLLRHGFRFSKGMGQNFLIESWVPRDTADACGADEHTGVLEIGPGIGPLTAELCPGPERWFPWSWTTGSIRCWRRLCRALTTSPWCRETL